ncbi:GNAT family N-acetyltransferase [Flavobacteriaceae bacterium]|nr:GNAT family N-acetyltransferase [Flavobacteriaceae bacterium]MDC1534721.1 GNAT family N-acetyltransferase [Flavobacteriaceae bacterium]
MIRKANFGDLNSIFRITKSCAKAMKLKNIFQWNDSYPSLAAFENDINNNWLYVNIKADEVIGCICISDFMDKEYHSVKWLTGNKNIYIHRLAVSPIHQKMGHAQEMMSFAENFARTNNYDSIRLDTFSKNIDNQNFYQQRGYKRLDNIFFPKQSKDPFYCYELVL